ncbi:MAG: glutamate--tRNA ligase [Armatimonadota bacterium]
MKPPRVRFAPSPTGSPHIGNIRTAVFDYLYARKTNGTFILRVEDTDRTRYVEGSLEEMMRGLKWMGMDWDEGPEIGGNYGPYFQSKRLDIYQKYAKQLISEGKAYYCYCTKERLEEMREVQIVAKRPPGYDRKCRELSPEEQEDCKKENPNPTIRFKMKTEGVTEFDDIVHGKLSFENHLQDDFVMIKADGFPTYQFASVVDDHLMEITHVIRGDEWISSTPKHVQVYEAFGWQPPYFVHLPLILDEKRKKLSKRADVEVKFINYIEEGYLPDAMLNFLATMGWSSGEDKKLFSREELIEKFSFEGIANHPAIFDLAKLNDLNGEYIRMMKVEKLAEAILPWLQSAGYVSENPSSDEIEYLNKVTALIQDRIVLLKEAPNLVCFFYTDDFEYEEKGIKKQLIKENVDKLLNLASDKIENIDDWTVQSIESAVREAGYSLGLEGGRVIHPIRMAITGRTWGPGLFELMHVIGKERCVLRLKKTAEKDWSLEV